MEDAVRRALEDKVRPVIQLDGGDVELVGVAEGVVTIRLFGACDGCPFSPVTLRSGVERILMAEVPGITEVVNVES